MERLYQYDICAIIIFIAILFSIYFRRLNVGRVNKTFIDIIVIMLLNAIFELMANIPVYVFGNPEYSKTFRTMAYYGGFMTHAMIMPAYIIFIGMISGTWSKQIHKKFFHWMYVIPFLINILVVIANPINNMLFTLSQKDDGTIVYNRHPLISVFYIVAAYYMIMAIIYIMKTKSMIGRAKTMALLAIFPCNIIALAIQFLFPANMVEMFSLSISAFLITVTVLRAEEIVDPGIGSRTFSSFHDDIERYYRSDKNVTVI
ncbi:MAG: hypothetical protein J6P57_10010, partial [Lachnospiraceae bacterium]|nr:hypothetical protein [Lachnospiraceae bacterium]